MRLLGATEMNSLKPIVFIHQYKRDVSRLFLKLFIPVLTFGIAYGQEKAIKVGEYFESPDKRFTLKCIADASDDSVVGGIAISDKQTGHLFKDSTDSVIYSVKWIGDSRSVAVIEYLHGGSVAVVYHFKGNTWTSYTVDPIMGDRYTVIEEAAERSVIKFTYKVHEEATDRFWIYSFVFNPETATRSRESRQTVDFSTYQKLKTNISVEK